MRPSSHVPSVAVIIFSAISSLYAQTTPQEALYLNQAAKFAPTSEVEQDEVIRFEADVIGNGTTEVFYTKASLRDGKHGYLWSVFASGPGGTLRPIGDVTFSVEVFTPSAWKADGKTKGFYTYFPSGGAKGSLAFFEVAASGITRRESRKIEPNGADKAEFDALFAARLTGESPRIELKRTALPKPQNTTAASNAVNAPPDARETPLAPKPPPIVQPPTPKKVPSSAPEPSQSKEPTSSTPWSIIVVLIVVACGLLWLLLKRRS